MGCYLVKKFTSFKYPIRFKVLLMPILYEDSMMSNEGTKPAINHLTIFYQFPWVKEQKNGILNHPNNIYEK